MPLGVIHTYVTKRDGCQLASQIWLSIITAKGVYLVCDKLGKFPYNYKWVRPEALKGQSIVNDNISGGCQSPYQENNLLPTFSSPPISRGTMLTMEVQHLLGFINIKTGLKLCLVDQRAKPDSTHNTLQVSVLCKPVAYNLRNILRFRKAFVCPCRALFDFPHSLTLGKKNFVKTDIT